MKPEGWSTEEWGEFVTRGRELVAGENAYAWAWGDLAHRYCPSDGTPRHTDRALELWLEEIGYEGDVGTVRQRRQVSAAWSPDTRVSGVSWTVHRALVTLRDRADVIRSREKWTETSAIAFVKQRVEQQRLEGERRYELVDIFGRIREAVRDGIRRAEEVFATLEAPIPSDGANGRDVMLTQLHEARDLLVSYLPRVEVDDTVDEAITRILEESR